MTQQTLGDYTTLSTNSDSDTHSHDANETYLNTLPDEWGPTADTPIPFAERRPVGTNTGRDERELPGTGLAPTDLELHHQPGKVRVAMREGVHPDDFHKPGEKQTNIPEFPENTAVIDALLNQHELQFDTGDEFRRLPLLPYDYRELVGTGVYPSDFELVSGVIHPKNAIGKGYHPDDQHRDRQLAFNEAEKQALEAQANSDRSWKIDQW